MNQLKPFLFWIVIGTVLVLELAYWLLSIPAIDLVGNKAAAISAKTALDTENKHLIELDRRSKNGSPMGVFDAEKASDIRRLTNDYLITPAWKDVLEPHVRRYDEQLKEIKEHLTSRSKVLHEPIAASSDKFGWYTAYQNVTEAQLKLLHAAQALVLPTSANSTKSASPKIAGAAPEMPLNGGSPVTTSESNDEAPDFATNAGLRLRAGFFTKGADLPDPAEHPVLTRQFRTMERLIAILLATTATNAANPLAGQVDAPEASHAAIAGVAWDSKGDDAVIGGDTGTYATGWRLTLTLEGSLSAVLAATAAIERPADAKAPVFIITGSEISRKAVYAKGERKDVGAEITNCKLTLLVLDFSQAPTPPGVGAAAPKGIPGGPPGGMSPGAGTPPRRMGRNESSESSESEQ